MGAADSIIIITVLLSVPARSNPGRRQEGHDRRRRRRATRFDGDIFVFVSNNLGFRELLALQIYLIAAQSQSRWLKAQTGSGAKLSKVSVCSSLLTQKYNTQFTIYKKGQAPLSVLFQDFWGIRTTFLLLHCWLLVWSRLSTTLTLTFDMKSTKPNQLPLPSNNSLVGSGRAYRFYNPCRSFV